MEGSELVTEYTADFRFSGCFYQYVYLLDERNGADESHAVLSKQFKWNERGVIILGPVSIRSETVKFLEFPLLPQNLRWFKETTSTAV